MSEKLYGAIARTAAIDNGMVFDNDQWIHASEASMDMWSAIAQAVIAEYEKRNLSCDGCYIKSHNELSNHCSLCRRGCNDRYMETL